jgi:hypothetical protein
MNPAGWRAIVTKGKTAMTFTGTTAVVTGASSGIGWALARELARQGARVGAIARRGDKLAELRTAAPSPPRSRMWDIAPSFSRDSRSGSRTRADGPADLKRGHEPSYNGWTHGHPIPTPQPPRKLAEEGSLFVDGERVAQTPLFDAASYLVDAKQPLCLGTGTNGPLNGTLVDVHIYRQPLNLTEIQSLAKVKPQE